MPALKTIDKNLAAFLDVIAFSEGTKDKGDDGYNVIVTGIDGKLELFNDYSTHPFANGRASKIINHKGLTSNASGRYQFMLHDYAYYTKALQKTFTLNNVALPFCPEAQDYRALKLIDERRATQHIINDNFVKAVGLVSNLWASLPGNSYGQGGKQIAELVEAFKRFGGVIH